MKISEFIPKGKENAISKSELMKLTGRDERTIRSMIKDEMRERGTPILSTSHGKGYWIDTDPEEIGRFLQETDRRIKSLYENTRELRAIYYRLTGQKFINVRGHMRRLKGQEK